MSRRIPVLVYGDCPELQACDLHFETTEIASEDLRDADAINPEDYELAVLALEAGDDEALECVRRLYRTAPSCQSIALADPDGLETLQKALESGLTDYVVCSGSTDQLAPLVTHTVERTLRHTTVKQRLHESERRFWTLFDQAPIGLMILGLNGRCEHANAALTDMLDRPLDELRSMALADLVAEDEDPEIWNALRRELADGQRDFVRLEQTLVHDSGNPRYVETACVAVRGPGGEPAHLLAMVTDNTDRKRIQENLEHADKMQAMGRLAGGVAHDFNNMLTIVESHCFIMEDALDDPDKLEWSLDRIRSATERGSRLTRKLLTFGRNEPNDTDAIDPGEMLEDMEVVFESLFGKTVDIEISSDEDLRTINVNRSDLEQVITNLALNARDAMEDGGRFRIRIYNLDVDVPSSAVPAELPHGQYTAIEVSDDGVGMPPDVQQKCFDPFFTTKEIGEGTGLGLSTVYGVVNQNSGHITVDSQQGQGTTFTIYFPSAKQESDTPPKLRRARQGTPTDGTETILVVEDEEELRVPLKDLLESKGYAVIEAADAEEALEISENHSGPIDLLLTDVIMPGIDGVSLADQITDDRDETSVILMSGYTADALSMESEQSERERKLLQKPFGMDMLSRTIRQTLNPS